MLYFHANAEDIVLSHELLDFIRALLKVNVIAIEYPGYGIYNGDMQKREGQSYANSRHMSYKGPHNSNVNTEGSKVSAFEKTPRFGEVEKLKKIKEKPSKKSYNISISSSGSENDKKLCDTILKRHVVKKNPNQASNENINGTFRTISSSSEDDSDPELQGDVHEAYNENVFESNEENILDDALYVYDYLNKVIGIEEKNILIFGRSMGSGPATHVASKRTPASLLLMSSFKSIRSIAED